MTERKVGLAILKQEGTTVNMDTGHVLTPEEIAALPPRDDRTDHVFFSSGRKIYANGLIVGIGPGPEFDLHEGYDGGVEWPPTFPEDEDVLTTDDMRELADMMIDRWQKFKATL